MSGAALVLGGGEPFTPERLDDFLAVLKACEDPAQILDAAAKAGALARLATCWQEAGRWAEARIQAFRKVGEMFPADTGGRGKKAEPINLPTGERVSRQALTRFRALAAIPADAWQAEIQRRREAGDEITTAGMVRYSATFRGKDGRLRKPLPPRMILRGHVVQLAQAAAAHISALPKATPVSPEVLLACALQRWLRDLPLDSPAEGWGTHRLELVPIAETDRKELREREDMVLSGRVA